MLRKFFTLAVTALLTLLVVCMPASASIDPWGGVDHNSNGDGGSGTGGGGTTGITPDGGTISNEITSTRPLTYIVIFTGSFYYPSINILQFNFKNQITKTTTSTAVVAPSNTSGK